MESNGMRYVKVYTTPMCPWCQMAKDFLRQQGVNFEEINVDSDQGAARDMIDKSGQMSVPVIDIDGYIIIGYDEREITTALDWIKPD